tara:strand:+ start:702 stop:1937 length:1236 start_codon:yes stop_codon:yes gene_type:complete
MEFRDYQKNIIERGSDILDKNNFLYLAMEVRTGKTLTSLGILKDLWCENVLFITKKKAISSIQDDYDMYKPGYKLTVINYESLHKLPEWIIYDGIIIDEAHGLGAFPKPSKRAKDIKELLRINRNARVILMSGTPTPESYSQMYHQVYALPNNPFSSNKNFYSFSKQYVNVTQKKLSSLVVNDYSDGKKEIVDLMQPYTINYTQKQAGFLTQTTEEILRVDSDPNTLDIIKKLKKNLVVEGKDEVILADSSVKLMMKLHQMYSGTVKFESGNSMVLNHNKANYIKTKFANKKIAIFYKFREELNAIKHVFGDDICVDLDCFNSTNKSIALQIVSGREGISLKNAEALIYYNIDFSATSYWQSRDRMTTKERKYNKVYWIFSKGGIEDKIYKAVLKKKDYTLSHFKRDLLDL